MRLIPVLLVAALAHLAPRPQDRGRVPMVPPLKGDLTGSLRGIAAFRIVVERDASEASALSSAEEIRALAVRRLGERKLDLGEPDAAPERRKPTATLRLQVESREVDGRAGNMVVGKLLVPCPSPNDPNGPGSSALLWEMRRLWIGPEERVNLRMRENVELIVDSLAADFRRENGRP